MFGGGVKMREAEIYIKKQNKKQKKYTGVGGGCSLSTWGVFTPLVWCKNSTTGWGLVGVPPLYRKRVYAVHSVGLQHRKQKSGRFGEAPGCDFWCNPGRVFIGNYS